MGGRQGQDDAKDKADIWEDVKDKAEDVGDKAEDAWDDRDKDTDADEAAERAQTR